MINIKLAKNSGFCFGVKRAIKLAEETANKYGKAITIGPIIHNPQMVQKLSEAGVRTVEDINEINDEPVIIRSHGIPVETFDKLHEKKIEIIDATCPFVAKAHQYAKLAKNDGYAIIILGNPTHPEIVALESYCLLDENKDDAVFIVESERMIASDTVSLLPASFKNKKIAVICQTTQNIDNLRELTFQLIPMVNELRIFNTICDATNVRQQSSLKLAKDCTIMIVIGGKNSSNTVMLAKLCSEFTITKHIEAADEIDISWFDICTSQSDNFSAMIGLTAGASTPDWIIIDIYNKIKSITGCTDGFVQAIEQIPGYMEEPYEYESSKRPQ
jgi:4-hydroxy-3-methylbut-2-enyl diphosphate reductase